MMTFDIQQGISIGPVKLGMTREELRKTLDEPFTEIAPETLTAEDGEAMEFPPGDYFEKSSVKVEYDDAMKVSFIEIGPLVEVTWKGTAVFEVSCKDLFDLMHKADPTAELDDDGIYAYAIGMAAYAPHHDEDPEEPAELISVFPANG